LNSLILFDMFSSLFITFLIFHNFIIRFHFSKSSVLRQIKLLRPMDIRHTHLLPSAAAGIPTNAKSGRLRPATSASLLTKCPPNLDSFSHFYQ
jgi:hypothetical protein